MAGKRAKLRLPLPIAPHRVHYYPMRPPPHPQSVERLCSKKLVPGAKKVGDCYISTFILVVEPRI